jgi:two-component system chemotaxis response regulator CheB
VEGDRISVLICDDSALMRNLIGRIIESSSDLVVAGKAMNGKFALEKIPRLDPDVMILDLEMLEMNGIEFLKERKRLGIEVPVVILSSLARRGAQITMEALALGASDFIMKPSGSVSEDIHTIGEHIIETVRAYGSKYKRQRKGGTIPRPEPVETVKPPVLERRIEKPEPAYELPARQRDQFPKPLPPSERKPSGQIEIVAIGISTGGPNALREVFAHIDKDLPVPVVVVQHMPAGFTAEFAKSLDRICPLEVKEAEEGDILSPGRILIAPGHSHVEVEKRRLAAVVHLSQAEQMNGHRPSADVLFASVSKEYGNTALAVIMTGMGRDGAREIGSIYNGGGITIGQDEHSCVVYGMPKVAIENGYIQHIVSLSDMAPTINRIVKESRR